MATSKRNWDSIKIPSEWRSSSDGKWARYWLGAEAGNYRGWSLTHPIGLVHSGNVKAANGLIEIPADTLVFAIDSHTFYLKKGKVKRAVSAKECKELLGGVFDDFLEKKVAKFEKKELAEVEVSVTKPTLEDNVNRIADDQRPFLDKNSFSDFKISINDNGILNLDEEYVFVENENNSGIRAVHFLMERFNNESDIVIKSAAKIDGVDNISKFLNDAILYKIKNTDISAKGNDIKTYNLITRETFNDYKNRLSEIALLRDTFEEDILSSEDGQILKCINAEKYISTKYSDATLNDEYEIVLADNFIKTATELICKGKIVFFDDLYKASEALLGGESPTFDKLPEEEKNIVSEQYSDLYKSTNNYDMQYLPDKESFTKQFLINKSRAKWNNYINTKSYEKNIPYVLRNSNNYVCWKLVFEDEAGNPLLKPWKIPINPKTGGQAMPNNPSTWGTFEEACVGVDKWGVSGIGVVFNNKGVVGIDLDGCIDKSGNLSDFASDVVKRVNSYTEISPSGTGLHILAFGKIPSNINNQSAGIEMYIKGHFVILTGNRLNNTPQQIAKTIDAHTVISELYEKYRPQLKEGMTKITQAVGAPAAQTVSSKEIILRMKKSANYDKYLRCAQGKAPYVWDVSTHSFTNEIDKHFLKQNGEPDLSALDLAFCKGLVFLKATAGQIDEIYRAQSATKKIEGLTLEGACLARNKWDKYISAGGETYGQYVINGAFRGVSTTYGANSRFNRINAAKAAKKSNFNDGGE